MSVLAAGCAHCGQPTDGSRFCCSGCRLVFGLIDAAKLTKYYALRPAVTAPSATARKLSGDPGWLQADQAKVDVAASPVRIHWSLQGVHCTACVWLIQQLFRRRSYAHDILVNSLRGRVSFTVSAPFVLRDWADELAQFGYRVGPQQDSCAPASRNLLIRAGICLALAANTMFFSAAIYFGLAAGRLFLLLNTLCFVGVVLSVLVGGLPFVRTAWSSLRNGVMHFDLPLAAAIILSSVGTSIAFAGSGNAAYADSITLFIALMVSGRWLRQRVLERNREQLEAEQPAEHRLTRRIAGDRVEIIPISRVRAGDTLLLAHGDVLMVDAKAKAPARLSLESITGESEAKNFQYGQEVPAGAINDGQATRLVARAPYSDSSLRPLLGATRSQAADNSPFWRAVSTAYVAFVLCVGTIGFGAWWFATGELSRALEVTTALFVVSCPCAFGIAVPLAYEFAQNGLRRRGLFVNSADLLDRLQRVRRLAFDKTGTLTTGQPRLCDPAALEQLDGQQQTILYNLCARSSHPRSQAVLEALSGADRFDATIETCERAGKGIETTVDGRLYRLGAARWALNQATAQGLVFSCNGHCLSRLGTQEQLCRGLERDLKTLRQQGYAIWVLSGDSQSRVTQLARRLELPSDHALGALSPQDKAAWIAQHGQEDTLFVGDGINDRLAAAQAFASGIPAIGQPQSATASDFYFTSAGLAPVALALQVACRLRQVTRRNFAIAAAYNASAASLALAGLMQPWLAAVLMPISSVIVITLTTTSLSTKARLWKF